MATKQHSSLSWLSHGALDERVVADLTALDVPRTVDGHWSQLAEHAALARVADHRVAEDVARMRRNGITWSEIGSQIGVSAQAAQQRFGKLPPAPATTVHKIERTGALCFIRLRRDRTAWGCACGAAGDLD